MRDETVDVVNPPMSPSRKREKFPCKQCGAPTSAPLGTFRAAQSLCSQCVGRRADKRPRELNDLTGKEWAQASRSIERYPDTRSEKQREHGACFPESLARQQISIYTKTGDLVLDPFVGVGTTADACMALDRNCIGVDINAKFARVARSHLRHAKRKQLEAMIITDDARRLSRHITAESVDFVLTSPPYSTLLKSVKGNFAYKWREHSRIDPIRNPAPYSGKAEDLGNMPYEEFLTALADVMSQTFLCLKNGKYAVWVVKDFRDLKRGIPLVDFHGDVVNVARASGFTLWDVRIYDQTQFRPLVCLGFPSKNFYLNIGHSYLLTFRKWSGA